MEGVLLLVLVLVLVQLLLMLLAVVATVNVVGVVKMEPVLAQTCLQCLNRIYSVNR
jgi:hypothetical protein